MKVIGWQLAAGLGAAACLLVAAVLYKAQAQDDTERALEKFRQMLKEDPWTNPALLDADRGEALWKAKKGPRNLSLESCDLGKGPGKVEGAFAGMPRHFASAGRVMDLETRILWCMEKLQGFDVAKFLEAPHPAANEAVKDVGAIATWVASKSAGMKLTPRLRHPKEKEAIALGETLFYRRSGPFDFSCASCHGESGKRIRLQPLPYLSNPEEARKVIGEWPAYRVSSSHVMTMQHRLLDCYWQMRLHRLEFGSDASIALISYLSDRARGGTITAPTIKR